MSNKGSDKNVGSIEDVKEHKINLSQKQSIELLKDTLNKFEIRGEQLYLLKLAIKNLLAEREQKDKRIQELEEYISIAPNLDEMTATKYINIQREAYIRGKAEEQQRAEQIIYENYIPKQVVKDKIEELMIQGNYKTFYNPNGRTHFLKEESDCKIEVLQELLEGEKNNENIKS